MIDIKYLHFLHQKIYFLQHFLVERINKSFDKTGMASKKNLIFGCYDQKLHNPELKSVL